MANDGRPSGVPTGRVGGGGTGGGTGGGGAGGGAGGADREPRRFPFEFSNKVPADTDTSDEEIVERPIPFKARVGPVILGWRDGADNAAGVQFRIKNGERFIPRNKEDDYIGFNDFVHPFGVAFKVEEGDTLVAQYKNNDTQNAHFVNCVAMVEEVL